MSSCKGGCPHTLQLPSGIVGVRVMVQVDTSVFPELEFDNETQEGSFIVWRVVGFGGRPNPLLFARVASFAMRTGQTMSASAFPTRHHQTTTLRRRPDDDSRMSRSVGGNDIRPGDVVVGDHR